MGRIWFLSSLLMVAVGSLVECLTELAKVVSHTASVTTSTPYEAMALYSGKWINDLGDYESCCNVAGAEYALFSLPNQGLFIGVGICGPRNCSRDEYYQIMGNLTKSSQQVNPLTVLSSLLQSLPEFSLETHQRLGQVSVADVAIEFPGQIEDEGLTTGAVLMLVGCLSLILIVAIATGIDLCKFNSAPELKEPGMYELMDYREKEGEIQSTNSADHLPIHTVKEPVLAQVLHCFSLIPNYQNLVSSKDEGKKDTLAVLDCARTVSMMWVVLGHIFLIRAFGVSKNPQAYLSYLRESRAVLVYGAAFAVDTFFWLSGFLMAFLLLSRLDASPGVKFLDVSKIYAHRFGRILPCYMFILFLTWSFTNFICTGPRWYKIDAVNQDCDEYWWTNLLFLNNFIHTGTTLGCMGQAWYLAVDMQLFIVSVPIVYLYLRNRTWGWVAVIGICLCGVCTSLSLTWMYNYQVVSIAPENLQNEYMSRYYIKPYTRSAPYALGIACGFILFTHRHFKQTKQVYDAPALYLALAIERIWVRISCFITGLFLLVFFLLIQADAYQGNGEAGSGWSRVQNSLYIGFSRALWGVGLSAVFLPMLLGVNRIGIWFLSLSVWGPLAKLTFCVYLIHFHLLYVCFLSQNEAYWFSDLSLTADFCFALILCYGVGLPLYLCVEGPFLNLEKLVWSKFMKAEHIR